MSILKIRDANGNVHEILAIKGDPGKTPVNGVDYYTDAEKEKMADDVEGNVRASLSSVTLADYILEQGHKVYYGGAVSWQWRKWASGVAEIWGTVYPYGIESTGMEE